MTFKIEKCSDAQKPFDFRYDPDCRGTPYEKLYRVWIHAYLEGEPNGTASDQVSFDVEIGNICDHDEISLTRLIDDFDYVIRTPASQFLKSFQIVQLHTECPVQCMLSMQDGSLVPAGYGITVLSAPTLLIQTSDKNLNGIVMPLKFSCRSTLSKVNNGSAPIVTDNVTVTYVDECQQSILYPANTQDATMMLYQQGSSPFVVPYSTFSCGEFSSSLIYPDTHPFATAPTFIID